MRFHGRVLTDDDKHRIHAQSLRILAEVGATFPCGKALKILAAHGAKVDWDTRIARLPGEMVEQALATAPRAFVLGARDANRDVPLPRAQTGYVLDGAATFTRDFATGKRRPAVLRDMQDSFRIFETLSLAALVWPNVAVSDFPPHSMGIRTFLAAIAATGMHVQHELLQPGEVPFLIDALTALLGSEDEVRRRKLVSGVYCPIPPLVHDEAMCEAYLEALPLEIPIVVLPMPATGTTGPAGLFGNVALALAESLSALVLFELARPGTPIILGSSVGTVDFARAGFLVGSPEMALMNAALCEMARHYGLPNVTTGGCSDAKTPGAQTIMEKTITTLAAEMCGADLMVGIGEVETSNLLILEQIVVDHEIALMCRRFCQGMGMAQDADRFADIARVGPGGHFLEADSTLAACRSDEFFTPVLGDRNTYEQWLADGGQGVYAKARRRVAEILAAPPTDPLQDDVNAHFENLMQQADKQLKR